MKALGWQQYAIRSNMRWKCVRFLVLLAYSTSLILEGGSLEIERAEANADRKFIHQLTVFSNVDICRNISTFL